jgi:hypothetical protein
MALRCTFICFPFSLCFLSLPLLLLARQLNEYEYERTRKTESNPNTNTNTKPAGRKRCDDGVSESEKTSDDT